MSSNTPSLLIVYLIQGKKQKEYGTVTKATIKHGIKRFLDNKDEGLPQQLYERNPTFNLLSNISS